MKLEIILNEVTQTQKHKHKTYVDPDLNFLHVWNFPSFYF